MNLIKVIIWLLQQKRHLILRTLNSMSFISSDEKLALTLLFPIPDAEKKLTLISIFTLLVVTQNVL